MQLDLIHGRHHAAFRDELVERLLREVADPDRPALRTDQLLHQPPRLYNRGALVDLQRLLAVGGRRRRPRPVHKKHVDVVKPEFRERHAQRLGRVVMPFAPELGDDADVAAGHFAGAHGAADDGLYAVRVRRVDQAVAAIKCVSDALF